MVMAGASYGLNAHAHCLGLQRQRRLMPFRADEAVRFRSAAALLRMEFCGLRAPSAVSGGCVPAQVSKAAVSVEEGPADTSTTVEIREAWCEFSDRVSGEWDGYGAEFTCTGEALELPSSVVPEAFKDWGVEIHDWQTQCPTLGVSDEGRREFSYKVIRLLPTVGCEADAATQYSTEKRSLEGNEAVVLAFHRNGSYTAVWPGTSVLTAGIGCASKVVVRKRDAGDAFEVEHCFVEEGMERSRVRMLQQFVGWTTHGGGKKLPLLKRITVYRERWEGPFRNGESLGGCGSNGSGFAVSPKLEVPSLKGKWTGVTYSACGLQASHGTVSVNNLQAGNLEEISRNLDGLVTLPLGLWSQVRPSQEGGFRIEAGCLLTKGKAFASWCEYTSTGTLNAMSTRTEHQQL